MRVLAIDWSGKARRAEEHIWIAELREDRLVDLRNGASRAGQTAELIHGAAEDSHTVVGLDFAFSFPRWWCDEHGWADAHEVWRAAAADGEAWLATCEFPFWGRPRIPSPHPPERLYRRTDREVPGSPKSVFQIGGAGAVGTGSIRGMPLLAALAEAGFSVWPFVAGWPRVVEIYPRALTGPVNKSRWRDRWSYLATHYANQDPTMLERAAGSEDAFDAAVSALEMGRHASSLAALEATADPDYRIEGRIWTAGLAQAGGAPFTTSSSMS